MGIQAPAEVKYGLILEAVRQDGNLLNISALCRIADVSRSGYYAWLDAAPLRQSREETDSTDFALVKHRQEDGVTNTGIWPRTGRNAPPRSR